MSTPICDDETAILTFEKRQQAWLLHCCFEKSGMTPADCWCKAAEDGASLPCNNRALVIDMTKVGAARYGFVETTPP
jgi:hypothetical protein